MWITLFVIVWLGVFHYESSRHFFLEPMMKRSLPKVKFLFPPAGWIMFFNVSKSFSSVDVYGIKGESRILIDPHDVFRTRTIGFDNIHRGILGVAVEKHYRKNFCRYLKRRFSVFDDFNIMLNYYSDPAKNPFLPYQKVLYQCSDKEG